MKPKKAERPVLMEAILLGTLLCLLSMCLIPSVTSSSSPHSRKSEFTGRKAYLTMGASVVGSAGIAGMYWWWASRRQSAPQEERCANCGYMLRGLPEPRCPECGQPFDEEDHAEPD